MCEKTEFIQCRNCPCIKTPGPQKGYYLDTIDGNEVVRECECHIKWRKERELEYKCILSNIKTNYTFNSYRGNISIQDLNALKMICDNPNKFITKQNYYLHGPNGTQKTSMSLALGRELIKQDYKVQYVLMSTLIEALVKTFNEEKQEENENFIKRCSGVDFLIIDECFDKKKVSIYNSGYQLPYLDSFIRTRYDINHKPTLYISNILPSEIEQEGFGSSIQNFIERTTNNARLEFRDLYKDSLFDDRLGLFKGR